MGHHVGSDSSFEVLYPECDDQLDPRSPIGELLRQAFACNLVMQHPDLADDAHWTQWQERVVDAFARRYELWFVEG